MSSDVQTFEITFLPDNIKVQAEPGESILDIANRGQIHINASCGGEGVCGRCQVELRDGEVEASPGLYLSEKDFAEGLRLACRAKAKGPATLYVPIESRADASSFKKAAKAEENLEVKEHDPMARQYLLELSPPDPADNLADLDRTLGALANLGLTDLDVELAAMKKMPQVLRDENFKVRASVFFEPAIADPERPPYGRLLSLSKATLDETYYGLSVDVGTTSVWVRLVNLATNEALPPIGDLNGQISFGEDVISRIVYAGKGNGLHKLQSQVIGTINGLLARLDEVYPNFRDNLYLVVVAGNTTMSHLLVGVEPRHIRLAPYVPPVASWPAIRPSFLGLDVPSHAVMKIFPSVSSYVGGDIVAGVLASGMYKSPELTLFIDVGTNGEIVIGTEDWMTCAACSAGPAFEGGGVKRGMRAAPGAIEIFNYEPLAKKHHLGVIGRGRPIGICGSGLINIVAELYRHGVINKQGKFVENVCPYVREGEDGLEYVLAAASESGGEGRDVVLTEIDVENLIRAKGAMFSGYQTLVEGVGLTLGDLERVIIAGGFGSSLNLENAIEIGLLPCLPLEKFFYIGNSSLTGATLALMSSSMWRLAQDVRGRMTNFELSETPGYMDKYMASQFIPHTDASLFAR
ncbi:MAG: ASKHA domain-containing protein [Deltaproteobacteria bacterium]|jgi:uncharacterized 2Fe-2S/4Fe-4S cluster protein (DUF4445 family)|nr:ASKHA domain-containing protein [Deltaproteobacteria bacterium]